MRFIWQVREPHLGEDIIYIFQEQLPLERLASHLYKAQPRHLHLLAFIMIALYPAMGLSN